MHRYPILQQDPLSPTKLGNNGDGQMSTLHQVEAEPSVGASLEQVQWVQLKPQILRSYPIEPSDLDEAKKLETVLLILFQIPNDAPDRGFCNNTIDVTY